MKVRINEHVALTLGLLFCMRHATCVSNVEWTMSPSRIRSPRSESVRPNISHVQSTRFCHICMYTLPSKFAFCTHCTVYYGQDCTDTQEYKYRGTLKPYVTYSEVSGAAKPMESARLERQTFVPNVRTDLTQENSA